MKILFGDAFHLVENEIRKMLGKGFAREPRFHNPFWPIIYVLLKLKFISETGNCIEFEFQCQINHGPEWNVKFSDFFLIVNLFLIIIFR